MKNIIIDFGAVGDGITDDTVAFQNAAASGQPVLIPSTSNGYLITGRCSLTTKTSFVGEVGAKIIHNGTDWFCEIKGANCSILNLDFDGSENTGINNGIILLRTDLAPIPNITVKNITALNEQSLISDMNSTNYCNNLNIDNIVFQQQRGPFITLNNANIQLKIRNILIDFTNSTSPNFPCIGITNNFGSILDGIDILGNNSLSYPNQHGIVLGVGEHTQLSNLNFQYLGGYGFLGQNCVNARITNSNFYQGCGFAQVSFNGASDCQMSNSMMRGKANGVVDPLIITNYGLFIDSCMRMVFSGNQYKSNGAGVCVENSTDIAHTGCGFTVNYYWGFVSGGTNTSIIGDSIFTYNGSGNVYQTSTNQHVHNCTNQSGALINFDGSGSI